MTADVWDYLCDDGYRCAILNVPMTYPPSPIDGTMVSGFGAAFDLDEDHEDPITHPPEFERILAEEYQWQTTIDDVTTEEGLEAVFNIIRSRFDLHSDILKEDYDYVHLTVFYINALQHKYGESEETDYAWELIDEYLGRIDTKETLLVMYSDHGHREIENSFVVNRWLLNHGYLSLTADSATNSEFSRTLYAALESLRISPKKLAAVARRLLPAPVYDRILPSEFPISSGQLTDRVDWAQTDAIAFSQGPLYLNRTRLGEEYPTVREHLRQELVNLTYQGNRVLSDVRHAEEVYEGPFVDGAPDLLLSGSDGWEIYGGRGLSPRRSSPRACPGRLGIIRSEYSS